MHKDPAGINVLELIYTYGSGQYVFVVSKRIQMDPEGSIY